jgi:acryloyl-coenzyme A reductase
VKAAVVPGPKQGLVVTEVPDPRPGKGEVVIRVNRAALCYRDLLQLQGYYPRMKYPVILGHEVVGTIEEVGEGVTGFEPGERVISLLYAPDGTCDYCLSGEEAYCHSRQGYSEELDGFFAEKARVKVTSLVKVPKEVSDEAAVLVPCVTGMIYRGIRRSGGIRPGELVLVTGASGGVGIHAIQVAKALGAKVIGVTTSESKAPIVKKYAKSLWMGGRLLQIGNVDPSQAYQLRLGYVILKDIKIVAHASATKRDALETLKLSTKIEPVIAATVSLDRINEGYELLKSGNKVGKVLVKP